MVGGRIPPRHLLPFPPAAPPGPGIPGAAMATDCDVSNLRPGTRTTSGCELIKGWLPHLQGGWTQLGVTAAGPRASGLQPLPAFAPFKPGSSGLHGPPPPKDRDSRLLRSP